MTPDSWPITTEQGVDILTPGNLAESLYLVAGTHSPELVHCEREPAAGDARQLAYHNGAGGGLPFHLATSPNSIPGSECTWPTEPAPIATPQLVDQLTSLVVVHDDVFDSRLVPSA